MCLLTNLLTHVTCCHVEQDLGDDFAAVFIASGGEFSCAMRYDINWFTPRIFIFSTF